MCQELKKELYTWICSSCAIQAVLTQSRFFGENRIPEKRVPYRVRRMYLRCSSDGCSTEMALAMFIIFLELFKMVFSGFFENSKIAAFKNHL